MGRYSVRSFDSLVSLLCETIYTYCDVKGLKTRLLSTLLDGSNRGAEGQVSVLPREGLERRGLTRREAEILSLVARGKTNKEVAADLHISPLTVRKHLEHVYKKLGVGSRTEAAVLVLRPRPSGE